MNHAPTNPPQNQALDYLAALADRCGMTDLSPWVDAHAIVCVGAFEGLAVAVQWSTPGQRTATTRVVARYEGTPFELKLRPERGRVDRQGPRDDRRRRGGRQEF
jgi:hypothetical protein